MFNALNPPFSPVCALRRTIQLIVCAMHGHKLVMPALFNNLSFPQYINVVRIRNSRKPVSNYYLRAVQPAQLIKYRLLRNSVERACCLVKHKILRF